MDKRYNNKTLKDVLGWDGKKTKQNNQYHIFAAELFLNKKMEMLTSG